MTGVGNVLGRENDYGLTRVPKKVREQLSQKAHFSTRRRHRMVSDLAYKKWQQAGCPHGRSVDFWLAAEKDIEAEYKLYWMKRRCPC